MPYLEFRYLVRNAYSFDLRAAQVRELGANLRSAFDLVRRDLSAFADFLEELPG